MQMDVLRCKTPIMVEKEIAAHLLAYNLVRAVMAQAAAMHDRSPRQLSFKTALQLINAFETMLRHAPQRATIQNEPILAALARRTLPRRSGRVEPRAIKRRPSNYSLLTIPRAVLRSKLMERQQRRAVVGLR